MNQFSFEFRMQRIKHLRIVRVFRATIIVLVAAMGLSVSVPARAQEEKLTGWERSIVTIEISRKQYDYYQPWSKRTRRFQKIGTVIGDHQILTTADELFDRTLVRLQKG